MVIPGFCEVFTHGRPWTEADYLALGVKGELIELIDGSLFVSLLGHGVESQIRSQLWRVLGPPADAVGLQVFGRICARIGRNRITIPDLIVTEDFEWNTEAVDATDIVLIGEITSESTATFARVQKRHLYAEAKIGWYLLVEPDLPGYRSATLRLFRLDGDHYVEHSSAKQGETLRADQPFPFALSADDLFAWRRRPR